MAAVSSYPPPLAAQYPRISQGRKIPSLRTSRTLPAQVLCHGRLRPTVRKEMATLSPVLYHWVKSLNREKSPQLQHHFTTVEPGSTVCRLWKHSLRTQESKRIGTRGKRQNFPVLAFTLSMWALPERKKGKNKKEKTTRQGCQGGHKGWEKGQGGTPIRRRACSSMEAARLIIWSE